MYVLMIIFLLTFLSPYSTTAQTSQQNPSLRSFDEIFPGVIENQKNEVFSSAGLIRSHRKNEGLEILPSGISGVDLQSVVMKTNPSFLSESLLVLPYQRKTLDCIDAYNVIGKISALKGLVYRSFSRNAEVPLFEDATRIQGPQRNIAIPDPPPAKELPSSEIVYIRLKDANFGNTFYRGEMSAGTFGVYYKLTNFRSLSYFLFPVLREEKFSAVLYMEPLVEGMLVYSVAGADASDFISNRVDIPSAISKRLLVFITWIIEGLKSL